jgi:hypothetical protein
VFVSFALGISSYGSRIAQSALQSLALKRGDARPICLNIRFAICTAISSAKERLMRCYNMTMAMIHRPSCVF